MAGKSFVFAMYGKRRAVYMSPKMNYSSMPAFLAALVLVVVLMASLGPRDAYAQGGGDKGGGGGAKKSSFMRSNQADLLESRGKASTGRHMVAVQTGDCKLFRFNAPGLNKFQVHLSATNPFGTIVWGQDLRELGRVKDCPAGVWLKAAVYREDELPERLLPPMRINRASVPEYASYVADLVPNDCKVNITAANITTGADNSSAPLPPGDSALPAHGTGAGNGTCSFSSLFSETNGTVPKVEAELFEAYDVLPEQTCFDGLLGKEFERQQLHWPPQGFAENMANKFQTEGWFDLYDDDKIDETQFREQWCEMMADDFKSPLLNHTLFKEPKEICMNGTDYYVYVRSCFEPNDTYLSGNEDPGLLLVHVTLDPLPNDNNTKCLSKLDKTVEVLNKWVLLALLGGFSGIIILLAGVSFFISKMNPKTKGKLKELEDDPYAKHTFFQRLYLALTSIQSASGYCRTYTITLATSAALLIAMIVWQPSLDPQASYDHAYYDYPYAPVQKAGATHKITYYLKIMAISALYGYISRLALCSNQGCPDIKRRGAATHGFNRRIWKIQVFISTLALLLMGVVIASFLIWGFSVWKAFDPMTKVPYT